MCMRVRQVRGLWYKSANTDAPCNRAQILTPSATEHKTDAPCNRAQKLTPPATAGCVSICAIVTAAAKEVATSVCACAPGQRTQALIIRGFGM